MQEGLFVRDRWFSKEIDMSRDPTMYPFRSGRYLLEFYYCPTESSPYIQDRLGWIGEGMADANYLNEETDRKTIVAGIRMLRDIHGQKAFKDLTEEEVLPGPEAETDEDLLDFARNHGGTVFHCCGTCRAGTDDQAVVDPELKVRGVDGLRVIDASVIPQIPSTNINAAVLMIGLRGAELLAQADQ